MSWLITSTARTCDTKIIGIVGTSSLEEARGTSNPSWHTMCMRQIALAAPRRAAQIS
jgi:hypothetical protein